ncbi:MAG: EDD domain protein [Clostridiales bacterium]|nr:MAG: EDD domain protein [Clostridiales bacterium]
MIRIVTDSTADITQEEAIEKNIDIVPLYVLFGEKSYRDGVDIHSEKFYELLEISHPKTSQPSPADFVEVFNKYPEDDILCITCSKKLSGTYQSAVIAKDMSKSPSIKVIDSGVISTGLRGLILYAIKMRDENKSLREILYTVERLKTQMFVGGVAESLEYLKRGGRVSHIKAFAADILKIKPIIHIDSGLLKPYKKKARKLIKALNTLTETLEEYHIDLNLPITIGYSKNPKNALKLIKLLQEKGIHNNLKENLHELGPVISTHTGPNGVIISFFTVS